MTIVKYIGLMILVFIVITIAFFLADQTWWRLVGKKRGELPPSWGDAMHNAWYATIGYTIGMQSTLWTL